MDYKMPTVVRQDFQARGWVVQQANYFFDGHGGTAHPHLHMLVEARGTVPVSGQGSSDIRAAVKMLAWSDGQQHNNGGGRLLIRVGGQNFVQGNVSMTQQNRDFAFAGVELRPENLALVMRDLQALSNQNLKEEMAWIWTYFRSL